MMLLRVIAAYGRALGPHTADVQAHPVATTFPPVEYFDHCLCSSTRFPQHFSVPTITDGYARIVGLPEAFLPSSCVGLTVH